MGGFDRTPEQLLPLCLQSLQGAINAFKHTLILDLEVIQLFICFVWLSGHCICLLPVPKNLQTCHVLTEEDLTLQPLIVAGVIASVISFLPL